MISDIKKLFWAELYDQIETETYDVEFLLGLLNGNKGLKILEPCCGTGRFLVPLAKAGYDVTGFDVSEAMLDRIPQKSQGFKNLHYHKADAVKNDWGSGYDVVSLGGNILINIETDDDYKRAQQTFIKKAYNALNPGGIIFLDFNLLIHPETFFGVADTPKVTYEGTDSRGTYGKFTLLSSCYDASTQTDRSRIKSEFRTSDGELSVEEQFSVKYIPSLFEVQTWLLNADFTICAMYGDYERKPVSENTYRAIIWACK